MEVGLPLAALVVALAGLVYTFFNGKAKRHQENDIAYRERLEAEVSSLRDRVETLEEKVRECERDRERLYSENVDLMRRLVEANGGTK